MGRRLTVAVLAVVTAIAGSALTLTGAAAQSGDGPAQTGRFLAPFEDTRTSEGAQACRTDADGRKLCKPAGATVAALNNGKVLFWDALEGTENVKLSIVTDFAKQARNDRSRTIDLSGSQPVFGTPTPQDAGANPGGNDSHPLPLPLPRSNTTVNDGDLFCADQVQLTDGRIIAVGGTDYYNDPSIPGTDFGIVELEGLRNARIYDPGTNQWTQSGSMHYGRWYPSLVTLPDGKIIVASGVSKLLKPLYPDRPFDSGTNVKQLEVYDPATGEWTALPESANRSLPLFPRLHLLPNGHVYYDVAGQSFNPFGQAYDEAFWNLGASFDPSSNRWTDLGVPGLTAGAPDPGFGFRGSTFSVQLPLEPNANGDYTKASFLTAGGTPSAVAPSPGTPLGTGMSRIDTVATDATGRDTLTSESTGGLNTARWYPSGVLLPSGEVMAFSGADIDEVQGPSLGRPVKQAELFDPTTKKWKPMATAARPRTYHNTAMLLPDGRVLVGGHAPISTAYLSNIAVPGANPNPDRDPTFEIYEPPYLFAGHRPTIKTADDKLDYGSTIKIATPDAASIDSVVMMRNSAITHLVDGDQRAVKLPVVNRTNGAVFVKTPPRPEVAPPGPYMLFVNEKVGEQVVPSVGHQTMLGTPIAGPGSAALQGAPPAPPASSSASPPAAPAPAPPSVPAPMLPPVSTPPPNGPGLPLPNLSGSGGR
jgi:hypothetical protein